MQFSKLFWESCGNIKNQIKNFETRVETKFRLLLFSNLVDIFETVFLLQSISYEWNSYKLWCESGDILILIFGILIQTYEIPLISNSVGISEESLILVQTFWIPIGFFVISVRIIIIW